MIGYMWLRIRTSGGLLWTRRWTFGFHKMPRNAWLAEELLVSQEGLSYMESVSQLDSSSSIGTIAHCGLWPVEQCPSIFSYLPPTLSIFSVPALEDLFLLPLYIFSWVFPFFSSLPVLEWRSFWASYPPPFSLGDLTSVRFALLSILLYFLLCSSLLVLDSSDFSIPRFPI